MYTGEGGFQHTTLMCRKLCFQRLNKDDATARAMAADTERKQGSGIFVDYLRFPYVFRTCVLLYRMFHVAVAGFLFSRRSPKCVRKV